MDEPLDMTEIHPESYPTARQIMAFAGLSSSSGSSSSNSKKSKEKSNGKGSKTGGSCELEVGTAAAVNLSVM